MPSATRGPRTTPAPAPVQQPAIPLPPRPILYEVNVWVWLRELSRQHGRPVTLATVPAEEWDALGRLGADAVWLMGVWERSPAGVALALKNDALRRTFLEALPDLAVEDIVGSPYCVREYNADPALGGREGLAAARAELARRGLGLILDFVPNHVAPDHPWVFSHPEYFIHGTADDLAREPQAFFQAGDRVIAHGRDPSFPPWPDVAQLNAFNPALRSAVVDTLLDIAAQCDGLRCDMVMLLTNEIFARTWGERAGPPPDEEFWPGTLAAVRAVYPDVCFIAEVYWDMEREMQRQGFDYCYDKGLYDLLERADPQAVHDHLHADIAYQEGLVRFIENHDEARAALAFPGEWAQAAAVAAYTLPGAKLFFQGQFEGCCVRLPVFLGRRPEESADPSLQGFYRRLLGILRHPALRQGEWRLCALNGWPDNSSYANLVAWCWQAGAARAVVVVNLSDVPAQARVQLPWPELAEQSWVFEDMIAGTTYERDGDDLLNMGLYVDLPAYGRHVFAVR